MQVTYSLINPEGDVILTGSPLTLASGGAFTSAFPGGSIIPGLPYTWREKSCEGSTCNTYNHAFTLDPLLTAGNRGWFTYDTKDLTDRLQLSSNVASLDAFLNLKLLSVPGVAGDYPIDLTYNSVATAAGSSASAGREGSGWALSTGESVFLTNDTKANVVDVHYPDGLVAPFFYDTGTSKYITPSGVDASLTANSPSSGQWKLTDHKSNSYLVFDSTAVGGRYKLIKQVDRDGNSIALGYSTCSADSKPELTSVTGTRGDAQAKIIHLGYDSSCHLASITQTASDNATRAVQIAVNSSTNQLTKVTDAAGGVYQFTYTGSVLTGITTPDGHGITLAYGTYNRISSVTQDPSGVDAVTAFKPYAYLAATYPGNPGLETTLSDANSHVTTYFTDGYDRVVDTYDADNHHVSKTYNADSNVSQFNDAAGNAFTYGYANVMDGGSGNSESLSSVTSPTGGTDNTYYQSSQCPSGSSSGGNAYQPKCSTDSSGVKTSYSYDGPGNQSSSKDSGGGIRYVQFNSDGSIAYTANANNIGAGSSHASDCTNKNTNIVDNCTAYSYDSSHNLVKLTPPDHNSLNSESLTYDSFGRLQTLTLGSGKKISYHYDGDDRVTEIDDSDGNTTSYVYNGDGTLKTETDPNSALTNTYDDLDRLTGRTTTGTSASSIAYTYDKVGNLATLADGRGTDQYAYDPANNMTAILEANGNADVFAYDADNHRTDTWDNASGEAFYLNILSKNPTAYAAHIASTLDKSHRLTEIKTTGPSSDADSARFADLSFCYSTQATGKPCGTNKDTDKIQYSTDNLTGNVTTYDRDGLGRLTDAKTPSGTSYYYCYDLDGNITYDDTTSVTCPASSPTYSYNSADQLTTGSTSTDGDGNTTNSPKSSPSLSNINYSDTDQQTSATPGSNSAISTVYSATDQNSLLSDGGSSFVNGQTGVTSQTTSSGSTYYVRDSDGNLISEVTPTGEYYYYFGLNNSVIGLLTPTGTTAGTYTYDPYGGHATVTPSTGPAADNPWRFDSGYRSPGTGLYHFGARWYDPTIGRWTQPDPERHLLDPTQSNQYAFSGDNPIDNVDPSGRGYFDSSDGLNTGEEVGVGLIGVSALAGVGLAGLGGILGLGETLGLGEDGFSIVAGISTAASGIAGGITTAFSAIF